MRAEALPELEAEAGQQVRDGCGDVVPVELMDPVAAHLRGLDDALLDQAREAAPHPDLRSAGHLTGDIADGHRPSTPPPDRPNTAPPGCGHSGRGVGKI